MKKSLPEVVADEKIRKWWMNSLPSIVFFDVPDLIVNLNTNGEKRRS